MMRRRSEDAHRLVADVARDTYRIEVERPGYARTVVPGVELNDDLIFQVATDSGKARAAKALRDEKRWEVLRADTELEGAAALYDGLRDIETVLTEDQVRELDRRIGGPRGVTA